ncbi:hypothetical protein GQ457_12G031080 [Hibiscus cannabinus]
MKADGQWEIFGGLFQHSWVSRLGLVDIFHSFHRNHSNSIHPLLAISVEDIRAQQLASDSQHLISTKFMTQSIDKPPYFNSANYSYWKNMIMLFNDQERKVVQLNTKAMHGLICALSLEQYVKVSSCDHATKIRDKLKMDPNEDIRDMFYRFSIIVNKLKGFGEAILKDKLVRKLIYSLLDSWVPKKSAIFKVKNLKELKLDELIGGGGNGVGRGQFCILHSVPNSYGYGFRESPLNVSEICFSSSYPPILDSYNFLLIHVPKKINKT